MRARVSDSFYKAEYSNSFMNYLSLLRCQSQIRSEKIQVTLNVTSVPGPSFRVHESRGERKLERVDILAVENYDNATL